LIEKTHNKSIFSFIRPILNKFKGGTSLSARLAKGSAWLGMGSGVENVLRFARNMILARVLLPDAFGTMAILLAVSSLFDSLTQVGIPTAIIQHPEGDKDTFLNGAWWFSVVRGIFLVLIAFFIAPFIADFYKDPELVPMMRIVFLTLFFSSALSAKAHVAYKRMHFKQWIFIDQLGGIIGIVSAIVLSFIYHNVWALVSGFVIESIAKTVLSFIICPFLPRFKFDKYHMRDLMKFTRGMLGLPIFTFIFWNIDVFVIGKLYTAEQLGFYSMALNLAKTPYTLLSKFVFPLLMPAFSEMKDNMERLNKAIIKITDIFCWIAIPMIVFVFFYGKSVIELIYTSVYGVVAIPFALLFAYQILLSFNTPIAAAYLAMGRPAGLRFFTIIRAIIAAIMIYPATKYGGLIGAASAVLATMVISTVIQIFNLNKYTKIGIIEYHSKFILPTILSVPIVLIWIVQSLFNIKDNILSFCIGLAGLLISYFIILFYNFKIKGAGKGAL
jgi:lipopolysaccharide exporter